jgi:hypothetical protein
MNPKICIFGTHHAYQYKTLRRGYVDNLKCLIEIHAVDLIAEEASGIDSTYAKQIAAALKLSWENVDLTREERKHVPDSNPVGIGTQFDLDLQLLREWVWLIRTMKAVGHSALLICGLAHVTGLAAKFVSIGCEVETNVYLDRRDIEQLESRVE